MLKNVQKNKLGPQKLLLERLKKVREQLKERKLDALLVLSSANRTYLTGWQADSESGFVLITPKKSFIITDSRYVEHATKETAGFEIAETEEGIGPALREIAEKEEIKTIGFEPHHLSVFYFRRIKKFLKTAKLVPLAGLIEELRAVKDESELQKIKRAASIADKTFEHILNFVKPGLAEKEVAREMEKFMREAGSEKAAWDPTIVASGPNSSMAHYGAGDRKIKKGDLVFVDFGCVYAGYCSDISRVFFVGEPNSEQVRIYNLVLEAQKLGINLVNAGRLGSTVDKKVRRFLEERLPANQTKYIYRHALGHGLGLEVHEPPSVNVRRKSKLAVGNVLTIEPGIYIPGWGGVRIEDMVLVTEKGREVLTKAPKEIREVTI